MNAMWIDAIASVGMHMSVCQWHFLRIIKFLLCKMIVKWPIRDHDDQWWQMIWLGDKTDDFMTWL